MSVPASFAVRISVRLGSDNCASRKSYWDKPEITYCGVLTVAVRVTDSTVVLSGCSMEDRLASPLRPPGH